MTAPRLEIDLNKIYDNARSLVERLAKHGISVTGVTKATLGSPQIAGALLRAGVSGLGDSRIENIEAMRGADTGRINDLRLGEALLLGCETLHRRPIVGLHTDTKMIKYESNEVEN